MLALVKNINYIKNRLFYRCVLGLVLLMPMLIFSQTINQVDSINKLAESIRFTDPDKSFRISCNAIEKSSSINYFKGLGEAYKNIGTLYLFSSENEEALKFYQMARAEFQKVKFLEGEAACINNMALIYSSKGDYQKALSMNFESYSMEKKLKNEIGMAQSLDNIGTIHYYQGRKQEALEYFVASAKMTWENKKMDIFAQTLTHISSVLNDYGYYWMSIDANNTALFLVSTQSNYKTMADAFNNKAFAYYNMNDYVNAIKYIHQSLECREIIGDVRGMMVSYGVAGGIYRDIGNYNLSDQMFVNVLKLAQELGNQRQSAIALSYIGENLRLRGELDKSLNYLSESIQISEVIGVQDITAETYLFLAKVYYQKNELNRAFVYWTLSQGK